MNEETKRIFGGLPNIVEIPQQNDVVAVAESVAPNQSWQPTIPPKQEHRPYVPIREIPGAKNGPRLVIVGDHATMFELPPPEEK